MIKFPGLLSLHEDPLRDLHLELSMQALPAHRLLWLSYKGKRGFTCCIQVLNDIRTWRAIEKIRHLSLPTAEPSKSLYCLYYLA